MSRKWKASHTSKHLICKKILERKKIIIWTKNTTIPEILKNKTVFIYNGKILKRLVISREKVGYKFGEFIFTRTKPKHKKLNGSKK